MTTELEIFLRDSILISKADGDLSAVAELCKLTEKYNLKWIADKDGQDVYYIMSQLSEAKGLAKSDYKDNWVQKSTTSEKNMSSETLPGESFLLTGVQLLNFKNAYMEAYGESLGRINSLWVGNWQHAYAYLVQGRTGVSKAFQDLGAKSIKNLVTGDVKSTYCDETTLQKQVMELASYTNVNFKFEVCVKNTFESFDNATFRRWDWVERLPKLTKIYELKPHTVTEQDVIVTLFDKSYVDLALQRFPGKQLEFIFCSPKGISWEAKTLIEELMDDQEEYKKLFGVKIKIAFLDLQTITQRLISNFQESSPCESWYWFFKLCENFPLVVSSRSLLKLKEQISEKYRTGILINSKSNFITG